MDNKIIDKVLSNNASQEEAQQVAAWFSTAEGQAYLSNRIDDDSTFEKLNELVEMLDHEIPSAKMKTRFMARLGTRLRTFRFRFAAAVLIPFLFIAGAFTYVLNTTGMLADNELAEIIVPYGEQMNVVLQDGTLVQLNSGSKFQYPKYFGVFSRKVTLQGEAYFSVAKEHTRPFTVQLSDVNVKVTGTKFNVKAYTDDNTISVSLEEGSVEMTDKRNKTYPLKMGQKAEYDKLTGVCDVSNIYDINAFTAWRTRSLNFYRTPLKEIIKTLERQYEVKFSVHDSNLLNYKFSISTSKINVDEILYDLQKVSKIKFEKLNNSEYVISLMN